MTSSLWLLAVFVPVVVIARVAAQAPATGLQAYDLRVEALRAPLGVDVAAPRLSWKVAGPGQHQTGYRILVATAEQLLDADHGDLWDSGEVDGSDSTGIVYEGAPLPAHQQCFWKVRLRGRDGGRAAFSEAASWTVGVLDAEEWSASAWVGFDRHRVLEEPDLGLDQAAWIAPGDAAPLDAPLGAKLYVARPELPADVTRAELVVLADDVASLALNGATLFEGRVGWREAAPIDVTEQLLGGANNLRIRVENRSKGPTGVLVLLRAATAAGTEVVVASDAAWRCGDAVAAWPTAALDDAGLGPVRVLGAYGMDPWGRARSTMLRLPPVPHLRTTFRLDQPVRRALLYGTALGIADFHLNGARVTEERFTPGWTDYTERVPYRTWDVTERLRHGDNVLGAVLADGWYSGYLGWGRVRDHYGTHPRVRAMLRVELRSGAVETIGTGPDWQAAVGAIREADFLMGERHDARAAITRWCEPGSEGGDWLPVDVGGELEPAIGWHPGPPVVAIAELAPVAVTEPQPGRWTFDLGQNFAGVARLRVQGEAGQELTLRFAERLAPDGTLYTANLRGARAVDTYVCRGDGVEVWEPRFTFHGFQYVELTGLDERPAKDTVTGIALSSDTPVVGRFECSSPMLNRLWSNVLWTQRANFIEIPTDCPQRDERLGWTGDAQVYVRTAALNCDVQAFFTKWLQDLDDAQRDDGQFPMVAPLRVAGGDGGPAWADAGTIVPWAMWEVYGDRRLLARQYPSMLRFVDFCERRSVDGVLPPEEFHCFGDWLAIDAPTPKPVIYTSYYAHSVDLTRRAAEVLGETEDAARLAALHERIVAAFVEEFVGADGEVAGDTQCGYVLALAHGLVDGALRERVAARLVAGIEARDHHLSTGFVGTKDLMLVLSAIGREDVAYRLLMNESFPSWGFSIRHGATSIWERWDGWTPEKGFQDPGMNSFAHYAFGAVHQWIVENVGGIRCAGPGYREVAIAPRPGGGLTWAKTRYDSVRGPISTAWRIDGGELALDVTIPANVEATVAVPTSDPASVRVSAGDPVERHGLRVVATDDASAVFAVPPGRWQFTARWR